MKEQNRNDQRNSTAKKGSALDLINVKLEAYIGNTHDKMINEIFLFKFCNFFSCSNNIE